VSFIRIGAVKAVLSEAHKGISHIYCLISVNFDTRGLHIMVFSICFVKRGAGKAVCSYGCK
jgi:hypothetical protein